MIKIIGVFFSITFSTTFITVLFDIRFGLNFHDALSNLLNPFWIIGSGEYVMIVLLIILIVSHQIYAHKKNKADNP